MDLEPAVVVREVETVDVAATLSFYVGTKFPSGCVEEVFRLVRGARSSRRRVPRACRRR